jgi:hypothetical protein
VPRAQPLWFGRHVLVENKRAAEILIAELPALAKVGINLLIVEVDYKYEYAFHPGLRAAVDNCSQHLVKERSVEMLMWEDRFLDGAAKKLRKIKT